MHALQRVLKIFLAFLANSSQAQNFHLDCWLTAKANITVWLQNVGKHYGKLSENSRKQWCVRMLTFHVRLLLSLCCCCCFSLISSFHTRTTIIAYKYTHTPTNQRSCQAQINFLFLCSQHAVSFVKSLKRNFSFFSLSSRESTS